VQSRGRLDLELRDWRAIAVGKTGELFAWCGRAAAHLGTDAEALERFTRCGRHFGVAFLLADDLKDLREEASGKDRFSDIHSRTPSYPLLHAVAASAAVRDRLVRAWRKPHLERDEVLELGAIVLATGAEEETSQRMQAEVHLALEALGKYRQRPGGAELVLWAEQLCGQVLQREGDRT
jgi:octaprenyl-diphosphate synthase